MRHKLPLKFKNCNFNNIYISDDDIYMQQGKTKLQPLSHERVSSIFVRLSLFIFGSCVDISRVEVGEIKKRKKM